MDRLSMERAMLKRTILSNSWICKFNCMEIKIIILMNITEKTDQYLDWSRIIVYFSADIYFIFPIIYKEVSYEITHS